MSKKIVVDPMTLSIIERRLFNIAEEMGTRVMRSARSYVTARIRDLGSAVFDDKERVVTQGDWLPAHIAGANQTIKNFLDYIGRDNIYPGDFMLGNDPYTVNSGHQPDWSFIYPIFMDGELISYLYFRNHQYDTGGAFCGCYWPRAYDVHSEALIIPPTKIFEKGVEQKPVYNLILKNVRGQEMMRNDHMLIRGSMMKVEERVKEMYRSYGKDVMRAAFDQLIESSEKMTRNAISKWPGGVYKAEAASDSDGTNMDVPVWVRLTLTIKPETGELIFDYTESDPQVDFINLTLGEVWGSTVIPLRFALPPGIPRNQGIYNCVSIITKPGTCCHPLYPASTGGQGPTLGTAMIESVQLALSQAIPKDVPAAWTRHLQPIFEGKNPKMVNPKTGQKLDYFVSSFQSDGSSGAIWGYDGWDSTDSSNCAGGVMRSPIETDERDYPYRYLCSEWVTDTSGDGQFRGGMGAHVEYLNLLDPKTYKHGDAYALTGNSNGEKFAPFGLMGGHGTKKNEMWIIRKGEKIPLHTVDMVTIEPGDKIITDSGGGGGVGDPLDREIEKVKDDARNEYISLERAKDVYGVIIDPKTWEVDKKNTADLRAKKKKAQKSK